MIQFTNNSTTCDTLICRGSGFERCYLDKKVFPPQDRAETKYYKAFNFAIRKAEKHIRKNKKEEGDLSLSRNGENISIKFKNADKTGNADIIIEVTKKKAL